VKLAQGFQVATAGKVEFVDVRLNKASSPTGNFWYTIETDSSGNPSGTVLATSDKYDVARLPTSNITVRIPFRNPATLSTSTQYHLVLQGDYTVSATNNMQWRGDTANSYANGVAKKFDGTTWAAAAPLDFWFTIYVTRNDTAITMPSGFDAKCLIGFVYNNASSNFKKFTANNRTYIGSIGDHQIATTMGTSLTHNDLSDVVPPRPVSIIVSTGAPDASLSYKVIGTASATDLVAAATNTHDSLRLVAAGLSGGAVPVHSFTPLTIDVPVIMSVSSGAATTMWLSAFTW